MSRQAGGTLSARPPPHSARTRFAICYESISYSPLNRNGAASSPVAIEDENRTNMWDRWIALVAEFVGTFGLVFVIASNRFGQTAEHLAYLSNASMYMVGSYAFCNISGGHLNPAVSLCATVARKMPLGMAFSFMVVQFAAGICAGLLSALLFSVDSAEIGPKDHYYWWEALLVENLFTSMLVFVVLSVTSRRSMPQDNPNQYYGLAIGAVMLAGGGATGYISGAMLNPAASLGIEFADLRGFTGGIKYASVQLASSIFGSILFRMMRPEDYSRSMVDDAPEKSLRRRLSSEFVGTFFIVLTFGLGMSGERDSSSGMPSTALAVGAAVLSLTYAVADLSGAHFNPSVSLAVTLIRRGGVGWLDALSYVLVQCLAGILASFLCAGILRRRTFPVEAVPPYSMSVALTIEGIFTSFVVLTFLGTVLVKGIKSPLRQNYYFGLAIGVAVSVAIAAIRRISTGALNPALSVGLACATSLNNGSLASGFTFAGVQLLGGVCAAVLFYTTHVRAYVLPHRHSM